MRYRQGDLISVTWRDPTGTINSSQSEAGLSSCTTIGTVLRHKGKELVLWTSMYTDGVCDTTTLNTGCIDTAEVIRPRPAKQKTR